MKDVGVPESTNLSEAIIVIGENEELLAVG